MLAQFVRYISFWWLFFVLPNITEYSLMACVNPLSMLAVSMLDMAQMVASWREATWRRRGCLWRVVSLDHSTLFREWIRFMKEVKYLCVCVCVFEEEIWYHAKSYILYQSCDIM